MTLISIVLPIYNQADHVTSIVEDYEEALKEIPNPHELLLVVNGSRDDSLNTCQALAAKYPSVRVISSQQGGWGLAVKLGIQEAKGDLLCYTNSARTSSEVLRLFVQRSLANPDMVIKANRKIRENWQRRLGSLLYNIECRVLFDLAYWDINGTPKLFPRQFDKLLHLTRDDDLIDLEFNILCRQEDYPLLEIPVFSTRRHGGKSTTKFASAFRMYIGAYRLWQSMRRQAHA